MFVNSQQTSQQKKSIFCSICVISEIGAVQKSANIVDIEKCRKMRLCSLSLLSIQPRTRFPQFLKHRESRAGVAGVTGRAEEGARCPGGTERGRRGEGRRSFLERTRGRRGGRGRLEGGAEGSREEEGACGERGERETDARPAGQRDDGRPSWHL